MISSFCSGGDCVEVKYDGRNVTVHSTRVASEFAEFTPDEWTAFIAGAKNGEFDLEALA